MIKHILSNGIPVFIEEKKSSPVVTVQAWVRQGSSHEEDEVSGISHFIEHMVFKGTKTRSGEDIASIIESCGGEINAFTSYEETAYHATLPSHKVSTAIEIIADIIKNPVFDKKELLQEKEVILEEIRRISDSITNQLSINLWKESFPNSPFGRPIIGFENTVKNISDNIIREYFEKTYNSSTISLFIVGDIESKKIIQLAEKNFSSIPKGEIKTIKDFSLQKPKETKIVTTGKDIKEIYLQIGYIMPGITDPLIPTMDLFCSIVGQGESSRLYQQLVKKKHLALDVYMSLISTTRCSLAIIGMHLKPQNIYCAIEEAASLIQNISLKPIESMEIERVKNSIEAEITFGKETVDGLAHRLGYYYCLFNDPEYEKIYLDKILAIQQEELNNALEYLIHTQPVISIVHPNDFIINSEKIKTIFKPTQKYKKLSKEESLIKTQKENVVIISKKVDSLPIISMKFIWPGGLELEEKEGLSNLFQELWTKETNNLSTLELSHTIESLGGTIEGFSGKDSVGINIEILTKHWMVIKPIVKEIISNPKFSKEEFITQKSLVSNMILAQKDNPTHLCQLNFMNRMYPNHPYGRSILGTRKSINSITLLDIKKFHSKVTSYAPIISSVGLFPLTKWTEELLSFFPNLKLLKKISKSQKPKEPLMLEKPQIIVDTKEPLFQSQLMIGFRGCSFFEKDRYALKLLSSYLAGQGGKLFIELREKKSLAYSVAPIMTEARVAGVFAVYIACAPEKLFTAITEIRKELEKVITKEINKGDLDRAKNYLLGRFELELQKNSSQATMFGFDEFYCLGFNHYEKMKKSISRLSSEDIKTVAKKYLILDNPVISIVNPKKIDEKYILRAWSS